MRKLSQLSTPELLKRQKNYSIFANAVSALWLLGLLILLFLRIKGISVGLQEWSISLLPLAVILLYQDRIKKEVNKRFSAKEEEKEL